MAPRLLLLLAAALAACGPPSPEQTRAEARRLRASFAPHHAAYAASLKDWNLAARLSLNWLDGPALTSTRSQAVADVRLLQERWAKVHFAPRVIHEALRFDRYQTPLVRAAHTEMLARLRRAYVESHDYQRYSQHAAQTSIHGAPPGRLPAPLAEFRRRLAARPPAVDDVSPLLASLPN